jgi:hypothetical protein
LSAATVRAPYQRRHPQRPVAACSPARVLTRCAFSRRRCRPIH